MFTRATTYDIIDRTYHAGSAICDFFFILLKTQRYYCAVSQERRLLSRSDTSDSEENENVRNNSKRVNLLFRVAD